MSERIDKLIALRENLVRALPDAYCTGTLYYHRVRKHWYTRHSCFCPIHENPREYIRVDDYDRIREYKRVMSIGKRAQQIARDLYMVDNRILKALEILEDGNVRLFSE